MMTGKIFFAAAIAVSAVAILNNIDSAHAIGAGWLSVIGADTLYRRWWGGRDDG